MSGAFGPGFPVSLPSCRSRGSVAAHTYAISVGPCPSGTPRLRPGWLLRPDSSGSMGISLAC